MQRALFKKKIHRARVADASFDYEGGLTMDRDLMDAADIIQYEQIKIYDISNGARFDDPKLSDHEPKVLLVGSGNRPIQA